MTTTRDSIMNVFKSTIKSFIAASLENMPDCWSKGIEHQQRNMICDKLLTQILDVAEHGDYPGDPDTKKVLAAFGKALQANPNLTAEEFVAKSKEPMFAVTIATYKESHQTTYHVTLVNNHQVAENQSILSENGRIIVYSTPNPNHANIEAEAYAKLLCVSFTPLEVINNE